MTLIRQSFGCLIHIWNSTCSNQISDLSLRTTSTSSLPIQSNPSLQVAQSSLTPLSFTLHIRSVGRVCWLLWKCFHSLVTAHHRLCCHPGHSRQHLPSGSLPSWPRSALCFYPYLPQSIFHRALEGSFSTVSHKMPLWASKPYNGSLFTQNKSQSLWSHYLPHLFLWTSPAHSDVQASLMFPALSRHTFLPWNLYSSALCLELPSLRYSFH